MPVSSSSSLTKQHRAQPSQRLSHSAGVIASRGLVRQNGASPNGVPPALTAHARSSSSLAILSGGAFIAKPSAAEQTIRGQMGLRAILRQSCQHELCSPSGRYLWVDQTVKLA